MFLYKFSILAKIEELFSAIYAADLDKLETVLSQEPDPNFKGSAVARVVGTKNLDIGQKATKFLGIYAI